MGRRIPVSLRMSAATKKRIDAAARESGLSRSAQIEALIERCLTYDAMVGEKRFQISIPRLGNLKKVQQ